MKIGVRLMKVGIRKPNIKSRIKARTTGKIKRKIKGSINPLYGKKGMGLINNPKKAIYNKIYNKTTIGLPIAPLSTNRSKQNASQDLSAKNKKVALLLCIFLGYLGIHKFYDGKIGMGILYLITGGIFLIGWIVDIITLARRPNPYYV